MCCPGDDHLVQSEQKECKEDTGYDTPTASSTDTTNVNVHSGLSTILFSDSSNVKTKACKSTSLLKSPVKSVDFQQQCNG